MSLTVAFLLLGATLLALAVGERAVRRLPLTPALVYLGIGAAAALLLQPLPIGPRSSHALLVVTELAVLVSLFAVGVRLRLVPTLRAWAPALLLAGPVMALAVLLGTLAAVALLGLSWGAAVLLAAILAPTDPVLASEVQIRHENDRDAVRLALTAEGGLNDGTALPAVMLGLLLLGVPDSGTLGEWWWRAALWPIGGGLAVGALAGLAIGRLLRRRARRGDPLVRHELIYIGGVTFGYGLALVTATSAFVVVFTLAVALLLPIRADDEAGSEAPLAQRLHGFGASLERIVEAVAVMAVGAALPGRGFDAATLGFALLLVLAVRPLSVLAVLRGGTMSAQQRRLVAWFGIRGVGSLYYLAFALERTLPAALPVRLADATLAAVAASIVLHGLSVTTAMQSYHRRRGAPPGNDRPPR